MTLLLSESLKRKKEQVETVGIDDWQSVDVEVFTIRANNQRSFSVKEGIEEGNYNVLMQNQPLYDSNAHSFESSHDMFRSVFDQGFPWELIEVFSGK